MYKRTILIISVLVASVWFWATVKPWLYGNALFSIVNAWLQPLIALMVLSSVVGLSFMLFKEKRLKLLVSVLSGLPFFAVFGLNYWFLISLGLLIIMHVYASRAIKEESTEHTKIKTRIIAAPHGNPF